MLHWILKTLWLQKGSVMTSAAGVAVALVLVVVMDAAFVGESRQIVSYITHTKADVWVMQRGVSNMHMASSFVWDWKVRQIRQLPGVKRATPILYVNTVIKAAGRSWFAYVVGLTPDGQRAGPWAMARGKSRPGPGEIILPVVLADTAGLKLGDQAVMANHKFRIAGFSKGTFSMANSIAFVTFADLQDMIASSGVVSYILVDAEAGQDPVKLARRIEAKVEKVSAIPQACFIKNDFQIAMLMGVEIVSFMTIIGSVLAALIIAFAAYSQVARRRRELAIIKALGFGNKALYSAVALQTFLITILALCLALLIATLLVPALSAAVPMISLEVTHSALLRMSGIALLIALLAALVPAWLVARVDPISAFKV